MLHKDSTLKPFLLALFLVIIGFLMPIAQAIDEDNQQAKPESSSWKNDWIIRKNFSLIMDSSGYQLPTAIAFISNPGKGPKDPLYFVTELRGTIKVVTNDRTVSTFADNFMHTSFSEDSPPSGEGEFGLAGICLAPEEGYVFATFTYQDKNNHLRNNIIRFETVPGTFSLKPKSQVLFTDIFENYQSGPSHQIGNCQVYNGQLYVGIGDGFRDATTANNLDLLLGKVARMTLDGDPVQDNPFYINSNRKNSKKTTFGLLECAIHLE